MGFYCFDIFGYKKRGFCATLLSSSQVFIFLKPVLSFFPESRLFSFQSVLSLSCFTPPLSLILSVTQLWSRVSKPSRARGRVGLYGFIFVQTFTMSYNGVFSFAWAPCIYKVYLVYRELCHLVLYTCPIVLPLIAGL